MKTKHNLNHLITFGAAGAQRRSETVKLRNKTQTKNQMKKVTVLALLGLLIGAAPPLLEAQTTETYTFTTNRMVPDGRAAGLQDVRNVSSAIGTIGSVKVRLKIDGEFNGDLYGYVRHIQNGLTNFCVLLNRPGKTASDPAGYADSGFDVTFQTGAPNGDVHVYRNVVTPSSPLTGAWEPDGRIADPGLVTDTSVRSTSLTGFNGVSAAGDWTLFLADLESGGTNMLREWGIDITGGAYPTVSWPTPTDIVYGTTLSGSQLNATANYASTNVPGTFTYTPAAGTLLSAGDSQTLSVTFTPTDTASFLAVTRTVTINVQKATATVVADAKSKTYGDANPALTAVVTGEVAGGSTINYTLATTATQFSDVGGCPITVTLGSNPNYAVTKTDSTLTVNAKAATVVADAKSKTYGDANPALTAGVTGEVAGGSTIHYTLATTATLGSTPNYAVTKPDSTPTVGQASTTGALASSANPALPAANVTFTMTLSPVAPGAGTPDGTVNFSIDGGTAVPATVSGGVASISTSTLTHGSHTVAATYAGSLNFTGSSASLASDQVINTPPVAGNTTIERYPTQGVKVRLSTLLANASDADNDSLTNVISALSVHGGTVSRSGDWVFYTPANGYTAADSFTFTVGDNFGASASGTVNVAIKVDNDPGQNLTITDLGNGSILITGSGIPGRIYRMQYTDPTNLSNWQDAVNGSVTADSNGVFVFTDTAGGSRPPFSHAFS